MEGKLKTLFEDIKKYLIEKNSDIEAIVLFGSYARNTQNDESDIDIAIKCKSEIASRTLIGQQQDLEEITKKQIDLVDLSKATDVFAYEILMNGVVLFCNNSYEFDLYKLDRYRDFLELNESRQAIIQAIKRGEGIYGK